MADMKLMKELMETIRQKENGPQPYDTTAEVARVEGSTAWVRIPGSDGETPVQMSINARPGDTVRVRVAGGHAWVMGNDTAPPTDDKKAIEAKEAAISAMDYVKTHLELTDEGLYVTADKSEWKVLVKSDGIYIIDASDQPVAQFKSYAQLGLSSGAHSIIDSDGQRFYGSDGTTTLANIGYGPGVDEQGQTGTAPYFTFGKRALIGPIGNYSTAEGTDCAARNWAAHAEGTGCAANGRNSHAEGGGAVAYGEESHAEGSFTQADGDQAHAEGAETQAYGDMSHAEGIGSRAIGDASHAQNEGTLANGNNQTAIGAYNVADTTSSFIIGNGTDDDNRSNALRVDWNGNLTASGNVTDGSGNSIPWICCGAATGVSVNANSSNTFDITFPSTAPTSTPRVFAILRATSTAQSRSLIVPVVADQSATGATVRVFNNSSSNLTGMVFNWIAMA